MSKDLTIKALGLITRMRDRLYVLAMEDADVDDQADAAALANEADALLAEAAKPWACHCDIENTIDGEPDECVFDNGDIEDCIYATKLQSEGKGKKDCRYWQPVVLFAIGQTQGESNG